MTKQGYKWTSSEDDLEETIPAAESDEEHEEQWVHAGKGTVHDSRGRQGELPP